MTDNADRRGVQCFMYVYRYMQAMNGISSLWLIAHDVSPISIWFISKA